MAKESLLKKEFKRSDVERVRNIVSKNYGASTKLQTGYTKKLEKYREGDIWEESGKQWTIKNGLRQNITKLDEAKKALRVPLRCPKCNGGMEHHLAKKMYKIHGFCFDCTVDIESNLRKAGLYEQYEQRMMRGNIKGFMKDIEQWALELVEEKQNFVTEQGDIEDWNVNTVEFKGKILANLKQYITLLSEHVK